MKHRKFTLVVAMFALLAGGALAQAQSRATVSIGFKFMAGKVAMPAGKYEVWSNGANVIEIREVAPGKAAATLLAITSLGRHDTDTFVELVFDSLSDGPHLSEVWFPGTDGYLVLATKEAHKHQVLQAK
jgi:hypothetical protein